ncbi:MAG TPA: hypothetical protein PK894_03810 [Defluviitoga sp.]|nr:hypothetical protein [Defluviitoga sp.]HOP24458.1 hypothetical protein [Defluviitoga sp.]HPZ28705.1 hypothetical protein [Defluviitoga sp.]HQD62707.1 hypothetical protein [Defluviitoga sp.]
MKKNSIVMVICILLASMIFSESVAYLTSSEHQIYESYFVEYNDVMGEYYNALLSVLEFNPQYESYFYKPLDVITIVSALMDYKALEKFLNDNGVTLDYDRIANDSEELFNQYMTDESLKQMLLIFFENESYFRGFIKSLVYRDEVISKINEYFTDLYGEDMSEVFSDWYVEYISNYDFVVSYEPLIPAYEIFKALSLEELEKIEEKYRNVIIQEQDIPEEWYISYVYLVENILPLKEAEMEDLRDYIQMVTDYPQLLQYSRKELDSQLAYYTQISETEESDDLRFEATQKVNLLQSYMYLLEKYGDYDENTIGSKFSEIESEINEIYIAYEKALMDLKEMNPESIEISSKLYQINPQDPNISYDYFALVYSLILDYYKNTGDLENIKANLNVLKSIFTELTENENLEKDKLEGSNKIIVEINTLLK